MLTKMCAAGASAALSLMWLKNNATTSPEVMDKFSATKNHPPLIFSSGNSCLSLRTAVMMDDRTAKKEHLAAQLSKICSKKSDESRNASCSDAAKVYCSGTKAGQYKHMAEQYKADSYGEGTSIKSWADK